MTVIDFLKFRMRRDMEALRKIMETPGAPPWCMVLGEAAARARELPGAGTYVLNSEDGTYDKIEDIDP